MDEIALIRKYQDTKDIKLRNKVVEANMDLVWKYAAKYSTTRDRKEELFQEGIIGLIHAIEEFDCDLGYKLSTYAVFKIRNRMQRYCWANSGSIRYADKLEEFRKIYCNLYLLTGNVTGLTDVKHRDLVIFAAAISVDLKIVEEFMNLSTEFVDMEEHLRTLETPEDKAIYDQQEYNLNQVLLVKLTAIQYKAIYYRYWEGMQGGELHKAVGVNCKDCCNATRLAYDKLRRVL